MVKIHVRHTSCYLYQPSNNILLALLAGDSELIIRSVLEAEVPGTRYGSSPRKSKDLLNVFAAAIHLISVKIDAPHITVLVIWSTPSGFFGPRPFENDYTSEKSSHNLLCADEFGNLEYFMRD